MTRSLKLFNKVVDQELAAMTPSQLDYYLVDVLMEAFELHRLLEDMAALIKRPFSDISLNILIENTQNILKSIALLKGLCFAERKGHEQKCEYTLLEISKAWLNIKVKPPTEELKKIEEKQAELKQEDLEFFEKVLQRQVDLKEEFLSFAKSPAAQMVACFLAELKNFSDKIFEANQILKIQNFKFYKKVLKKYMALLEKEAGHSETEIFHARNCLQALEKFHDTYVREVGKETFDLEQVLAELKAFQEAVNACPSSLENRTKEMGLYFSAAMQEELTAFSKNPIQKRKLYVLSELKKCEKNFDPEDEKSQGPVLDIGPILKEYFEVLRKEIDHETSAATEYVLRCVRSLESFHTAYEEDSKQDLTFAKTYVALKEFKTAVEHPGPVSTMVKYKGLSVGLALADFLLLSGCSIAACFLPGMWLPALGIGLVIVGACIIGSVREHYGGYASLRFFEAQCHSEEQGRVLESELRKKIAERKR